MVWAACRQKLAKYSRLLQAFRTRQRDMEGFLRALGSLASSRIQREARDYQSDFTINYRGLFEADPWVYRWDVLEACVGNHVELWVNGIKYSISAPTRRAGEALNGCYDNIVGFLQVESLTSGLFLCIPTSVCLDPLLVAFEKAWVAWERDYIHELIEIEKMALEPLQVAVDLETELRSMQASCDDSGCPTQNAGCLTTPELDAQPGQSTALKEPGVLSLAMALQEHSSTLGKIVQQATLLNTMANVAGKGRDDLTIGVLEEAARVLLSRPEAEFGSPYILYG